MSLKYHIIHFIVKDMEKQLEIDQKKVKSTFQNSFTFFRSPLPNLPSWIVGSSGSWLGESPTGSQSTRRTFSDRSFNCEVVKRILKSSGPCIDLKTCHTDHNMCVAGSQRVSLSGIPALQDACNKLQHVQGTQKIQIRKIWFLDAYLEPLDHVAYNHYNPHITARIHNITARIRVIFSEPTDKCRVIFVDWSNLTRKLVQGRSLLGPNLFDPKLTRVPHLLSFGHHVYLVEHPGVWSGADCSWVHQRGV